MNENEIVVYKNKVIKKLFGHKKLESFFTEYNKLKEYFETQKIENYSDFMELSRENKFLFLRYRMMSNVLNFNVGD
jgi:hypothetical protein